MSSFVIPALNTGNVTQQRLQGNNNAQNIAALQTQVSALTTTPSGEASLTTTTNGNGSYFQLTDGTLVQWGTAPSVSGGGVAPAKTFPTPFKTSCVILTTVFAGNGNIISSVVSTDLKTFTYQVDGVVFIGGSGTTPTGSETVEWFAIGA